jgi:hypothetical protein
VGGIKDNIVVGLDEVISDDGRTKRATAFGKEQHLELQMVFMGLWEPWDALWVLLDHGLIDADERDTLEDCLCTGSDPEVSPSRRWSGHRTAVRELLSSMFASSRP